MALEPVTEELIVENEAPETFVVWA